VTREQAEKYRRLALECRAMARTVSTDQARPDLTAMAEVWECLADQQDQSTDLSQKPPAPAAEQPPMQQQQQIPPDEDKKK
jgi:hypothetical protein